MSGLPLEERQRLLDLMASWLDALGEREPAPEGLAPEALDDEAPAPDLFTLLSQMTALAQETRLLGRATTRLTAEMSEKLELLGEGGGSSAEALSRVRRDARLELAAELLDVRDRLERGVWEGRARLAAIPAWRLRLLGGAGVLEALVSGSELALARIDDVLGRLAIRQVVSAGRPFDPTTMRAADASTADGVPASTVLEVYRSGWVAGDTVLRYAEVKVAKLAAGGSQEQGAEGKSNGCGNG